MSLYLIQCKRGYLGDSVVWWRENSAGYTVRIDEAGRYSAEEARRIEAIRGEERAIPEDVALAAASRHVMAGDLHKALHAAPVAAADTWDHPAPAFVGGAS